MKIRLRLFLFIIIFSLSCFAKCLVLNERKKIILRKLERQERILAEGDPADEETPADKETPADDENPADETPSKQDEDELKYEECQGMTAYEPTDCFDIELDFKKNIKKCCFLEYKDKKYDNKRKRICTILTNDEFLDIKKTIKSIKENNKNYTVLSLECDKSNILSLNIALLLIILLFSL